jgi:hypothetical protein
VIKEIDIRLRSSGFLGPIDRHGSDALRERRTEKAKPESRRTTPACALAPFYSNRERDALAAY